MFNRFLFYYSAIASLFITISLVFTSQSIIPVVFATLFLPVTAYFTIEFFKHLKGDNDLKLKPSKWEVLVISAIFLALVGVSIKNIFLTPPTESPTPGASSQPLIFKTKTTPGPSNNTINQ
jgi:hypothetical protein